VPFQPSGTALQTPLWGTVVINLSLGATESMHDVPNLVPSLMSPQVRDIVVVFHPSEGEASPIPIRDMDGLFRFLEFQWFTHDTMPRLTIVDGHLISREDEAHLVTLISSADTERLRADSQGGQRSVLEVYAESFREQIALKAPIEEDAIRLISSEEYRVQVGDERFNLYTDDKFFLH
jgi:hypothetical protein